MMFLLIFLNQILSIGFNDFANFHLCRKPIELTDDYEIKQLIQTRSTKVESNCNIF